jgi:hypothetical protein
MNHIRELVQQVTWTTFSYTEFGEVTGHRTEGVVRKNSI